SARLLSNWAARKNPSPACYSAAGGSCANCSRKNSSHHAPRDGLHHAERDGYREDGLHHAERDGYREVSPCPSILTPLTTTNTSRKQSSPISRRPTAGNRSVRKTC